MVTFNRNYSDGQSFPFRYSCLKERIASHISTNRTLVCGESPLSLIIAWDSILESTSDVLEFRSTSFNGSRNLVSPHAELAVLFVSILNRFQLLIWKCEAHADGTKPFEIRTASPPQILQSIHQDLVKLRQQVDDSIFEFQCEYGTAELVEQLEKFYELLAKFFAKQPGC